MMRVIFVVFFGKSRSHSSEHASEVGGLMLVPLLILAVLALISGYGFIADRLVPFNGFVSESFHMGMPFYVSMGALVLGILLAAAFYAGSPASDKLSGNAVSRLSPTAFILICSMIKCWSGESRAFWPPSSTLWTSSSSPASSLADWRG